MPHRARIGGFALAAALLVGAPADAHHAFNMYDYVKYTPLDGTVKNWVWRNPHAMIDLVAKGPNGEVATWSVECSSPNIIGRKGWSSDSVKIGDKLHVVVHPMKNGLKIALMVSATLPDGQVLKDKD